MGKGREEIGRRNWKGGGRSRMWLGWRKARRRCEGGKKDGVGRTGRWKELGRREDGRS